MITCGILPPGKVNTSEESAEEFGAVVKFVELVEFVGVTVKREDDNGGGEGNEKDTAGERF